MRLLVVDDQPRLARALRRGLAAEGFIVDIEADGEAGLEAARHGEYDALVLDVMLPRRSGFSIVKTLRAEHNWVPILMLSARDGEYDQATGLDAGADDYLTKPFSYVVLLARLRALVRRGAIERPVALTVGDLCFDPATRELTVAGEPVTMTHRELSLLEYLMRRPGQVVSKLDLLDQVWDASERSETNVVEVYIGYLRRKIGRDRVQTVRGAGYRLVAGSDPGRDGAG